MRGPGRAARALFGAGRGCAPRRLTPPGRRAQDRPHGVHRPDRTMSTDNPYTAWNETAIALVRACALRGRPPAPGGGRGAPAGRHGARVSRRLG